MTNAPEITFHEVNYGEPMIGYTVVYEPGHFAFGVMPHEVWEVWHAAGCPVHPEEAGLVWEGGEYGNYALAA